MSYSFGERGPETVIPGAVASSGARRAGSGGRTVMNFQFYGTQYPSPEQQQAMLLKASP